VVFKIHIVIPQVVLAKRKMLKWPATHVAVGNQNSGVVKLRGNGILDPEMEDGDY
jgi:hypothetical protein